MKEVLDIRYKELEESKPILEVLENYVMYKKKLDEILIVKINGVVEMVALVDTGASVSILPYSLYKDLGLGDPRPYQTNLTMADNTQAKAMGEVKKYEDPNRISSLHIKDDMERALAMEAYFIPFKNVIVFKKLVDFLGLLPVQLKNLDWGNEGYGTYKKVDGDGD
ncbi:copia protein [Tanacetum coccineum]